ncbi:hypothetical protein M3J09_001962 [Ascochyta lentis]
MSRQVAETTNLQRIRQDGAPLMNTDILSTQVAFILSFFSPILLLQLVFTPTSTRRLYFQTTMLGHSLLEINIAVLLKEQKLTPSRLPFQDRAVDKLPGFLDNHTASSRLNEIQNHNVATQLALQHYSYNNDLTHASYRLQPAPD